MDRPGGTVLLNRKRGRRRAGHSTSIRYAADAAPRSVLKNDAHRGGLLGNSRLHLARPRAAVPRRGNAAVVVGRPTRPPVARLVSGRRNLFAGRGRGKRGASR